MHRTDTARTESINIFGDRETYRVPLLLFMVFVLWASGILTLSGLVLQRDNLKPSTLAKAIHNPLTFRGKGYHEKNNDSDFGNHDNRFCHSDVCKNGFGFLPRSGFAGAHCDQLKHRGNGCIRIGSSALRCGSASDCLAPDQICSNPIPGASGSHSNLWTPRPTNGLKQPLEVKE